MRNGSGKGACDMDTPLPVMHAMSTPRERSRALQEQAAILEREGGFDEAVRYWQASGELAVTDGERDWCEARALFCQKRCQQA
ncbi:ANR family transcriptional regulator [Serratia sp. PL7]|uniref:ANR family transcriptional regulator n=3 Tax=Serratia TaxID=613 RepID=UPI0021ADE013|nr:ANR family transcriptional regulator [Serratia sp. PL7]